MEAVTSNSYLQAQARRREMEASIGALERAVAAASSAPGWAISVRDRLVDLQEALTHHVEAVEADDGLLADIETAAPRLANAVGSMRRDHVVLAGDITELIEAAERREMSDVRDATVELLHSMMLHRQRGSDLVYEAFSRDIGGLDS